MATTPAPGSIETEETRRRQNPLRWSEEEFATMTAKTKALLEGPWDGE
jgi:hypothetical protein